ncbi:2169_t:CDS:2, partial [Ambispora leptoticha]
AEWIVLSPMFVWLLQLVQLQEEEKVFAVIFYSHELRMMLYIKYWSSSSISELCRSEKQLLGNHLNYLEKFKSLFSEQYEQEINRHPSRHQFPIQNAFALTIHKTQGLTLLYTTLSINDKIFAEGQVYVAMSRAPTWESINIVNFNLDSVKTNVSVINEYARLSE